MRIPLAEAVRQIVEGADWASDQGNTRPFFFIVGAGMSAPEIPTASAIEEMCRQAGPALTEAELAPTDPMARYEFWFSRAFPQAVERQTFLRSLIADKPLSQANLRIAHVLAGGNIGHIVITPNFDTQIAQALRLFGIEAVVCDHPRTGERIDPERPEIQIVHVHGTHWFYDAANLTQEIVGQATPDRLSVHTMVQLLDAVLRQRSPIVVGYSGWERDVIMTSLRRRLGSSATPSRLQFNLYWFCHTAAAADGLPDWITLHPNVHVVAPPSRAPGSARRTGADKAKLEAEPVLDARQVFDTVVAQQSIPPPRIAGDPLGFLSDQLSAQVTAAREDDLYGLLDAVDRIERAREWETQHSAAIERSLQSVYDSLGRSDYRKALRAGGEMEWSVLAPAKQSRLAAALLSAAVNLDDNSADERDGYDVVVAISDHLISIQFDVDQSRRRIASAMQSKSVAWSRRHQHATARAILEELISRFGDSTLPEDQHAVANARIHIGLSHFRSRNTTAERAAYRRALEGNGEEDVSTEGKRLRARATYFLSTVSPKREKLRLLTESVAQLRTEADPLLQGEFGVALNALALALPNGSDGQMAALDEAIERFDQAPDSLRKYAVAARRYKAHALELLDAPQALSLYEEVSETEQSTGDAEIGWHAAASARRLARLAEQSGEKDRANEMRRGLWDRFRSAAHEFAQVEAVDAYLDLARSVGPISETAIGIYNDIIQEYPHPSGLLRRAVGKAKKVLALLVSTPTDSPSGSGASPPAAKPRTRGRSRRAKVATPSKR